MLRRPMPKSTMSRDTTSKSPCSQHRPYPAARFAGSMDEAGAAAETSRGCQVVECAAHIMTSSASVPQVDRAEINLAIWLVVARELGRKDEVPRKTGMPCHVGKAARRCRLTKARMV